MNVSVKCQKGIGLQWLTTCSDAGGDYKTATFGPLVLIGRVTFKTMSNPSKYLNVIT